MATIDDFYKVELKIGKIIAAEKVEGADKLLRLTVDFGAKEVSDTPFQTAGDNSVPVEQEKDVRQILSGIAMWYQPEDLVGKLCPFVTNIPPRTLRGFESHGMILAVGVGESAVLLHPDKDVEPGSKLR